MLNRTNYIKSSASKCKWNRKRNYVFTDTMGQVTTIGGASNPRGAAAAALKDIINLYRKDLSRINRE